MEQSRERRAETSPSVQKGGVVLFSKNRLARRREIEWELANRAGFLSAGSLGRDAFLFPPARLGWPISILFGRERRWIFIRFRVATFVLAPHRDRPQMRRLRRFHKSIGVPVPLRARFEFLARRKCLHRGLSVAPLMTSDAARHFDDLRFASLNYLTLCDRV